MWYFSYIFSIHLLFLVFQGTLDTPLAVGTLISCFTISFLITSARRRCQLWVPVEFFLPLLLLWSKEFTAWILKVSLLVDWCFLSCSILGPYLECIVCVWYSSSNLLDVDYPRNVHWVDEYFPANGSFHFCNCLLKASYTMFGTGN